ncbi:MAG: 4-(cytidine 5'-diphospho)-2-C-methyl-D-erythritol kinase [Flavisolibacter sp.]|nr:4-(cytidine 5'-diphospho)-2-C-methyl-D-erythritol kinase [Flavisolibacter sp.]
MVVFPNCKINLGLHILQKRDDGFHDLETIFYPIPLSDALEIVHSDNPMKTLDFSITGRASEALKEDNICIKAYQLIKGDYSTLPPLKMHLHKVIPTGAGLGGGSADGAFTLLLLNKRFELNISEEKLSEYAARLGSDCSFFIKNVPCYATGRGEQLEEVKLDLSTYKFIIVNPGIHIQTAWAFSQIKPLLNRKSLKEIITEPIESWKENLSNDFEPVIFSSFPEIESIKKSLYDAGAVYASLSGSGASVYGIFNKAHAVTLSFPPHYFVKEC